MIFRGGATIVDIPLEASLVSITFDLGGRGNMQHVFDPVEASVFGTRVYNRGGQDADRPHDAVFHVSQQGAVWRISGGSSWSGTPIIRSVVIYQ